MPPAKSAVWKHFKRASDDKTVKCTLCSTELTYKGSTSNMLNHLRLKHAEISTQSPVKEKQTAMTTFMDSPRKLSPDRKERITQAIANMVVCDYLPLSLVEGEGFKKLMEVVAPDYEVPCRKTIRARILMRYDGEREQLCNKLYNIHSASLTTDTWTSTATDAYMTVTEHHITDEWEMEGSVLMTRAMPERHTGANIAEKLRDCVAEFGLTNKVESVVHDNARNMECAGEMCPEWTDHGCFAHTLQLCIKPALSIPLVEKTVTKCRKLVGHFKHSTTLTAEFRKRQKALELPQHALIQDVATRWNSTQQMLERVCEQRRVLTDILLDNKVTKNSDTHLLPSEREWNDMSEISSVLKDLTHVTTFISAERDVSCSYIYPIVCGLLNSSLKVGSEDSVVAKKVKESVGEELTRRFRPHDTETASTLPAVASLLDPRYKRLPFFTPEQRKAVECALETRLDDIPLRLPGRDHNQQPPSKVAKNDGVLHFLNFTSPEKSGESDELKEYLLEKGGNVKPLEWWRKNEEKFPRIAIVARKILAVPASSVPSERVFSSAGILVNKLRNRLSPTLVDSIIFLNKNALPDAEASAEDSDVE